MSEQLTKGEREVLEELVVSSGRIESGDIASKLGEKEERIVSILNSLSQRGLIELISRETATYSLTDEGKEYAENGLPEVRLFRAVSELNGRAELDRALSKAGISKEAKGIAMSWTRKNGWLGFSRENGNTVLETKVGSIESPLESLLRIFQAGDREIPEKLKNSLKASIERSLVIVTTIKSFEAEIAVGMRPTAEKLLGIEISGVLDLTPEMLTSGTWRETTFRPYNVELQPAYVNYG
ncbi:MAG: hypothetical protein ACFE7R_05325, partial [Candidatus Hodarchaeota archaeon]